RLKVSVAQPVPSVGCSVMLNWLNGVPVPYTSAPWTSPPHGEVEVTCTRSTNDCVPRVKTDGLAWNWSMTSFVGSDIADTCFGFPDGQLVGVGGAGAAAFKITADGTEVADVWPSALLAVTRSLTVFPTSAAVSV